MARVVYRDENYQTVYVDVNAQTPEVTIGRSAGNMIQIPSKSLSRNHAKIVFQGGRYIFIDLHSSNGSYVNNTRIKTQEIHPGDSIKCGDVSLEFTDDSLVGGKLRGVRGIGRGLEAPKLPIQPNIGQRLSSSEQRGINIRPISSPGTYRPTMPSQPTFDQDMAQLMARQIQASSSSQSAVAEADTISKNEALEPVSSERNRAVIDAAASPMSFDPNRMGPRRPSDIGRRPSQLSLERVSRAESSDKHHAIKQEQGAQILAKSESDSVRSMPDSSAEHGAQQARSPRYSSSFHRPSRPSRPAIGFREFAEVHEEPKEGGMTQAITHQEFVQASGGETMSESRDRGAGHDASPVEDSEERSVESDARRAVSSAHHPAQRVARAGRQRAGVPTREPGTSGVGLRAVVPVPRTRDRGHQTSRPTQSQSATQSRVSRAPMPRHGRGYAAQRYVPVGGIEDKKQELKPQDAHKLAEELAPLESSSDHRVAQSSEQEQALDNAGRVLSSSETSAVPSSEDDPASELLLQDEAPQNEASYDPYEESQRRFEERLLSGQSEIINIDELLVSEVAVVDQNASVLPKTGRARHDNLEQASQTASSGDAEYLKKLKFTMAQQKETLQALREISAEMSKENLRLQGEVEKARNLRKEDQSNIASLKTALFDIKAELEASRTTYDEQKQRHADEHHDLQKRCDELKAALDIALDEGVVAKFKQLWQTRFEQLAIYAEALELAVDSLGFGEGDAKAIEQVRSMREVIAFCEKEL